ERLPGAVDEAEYAVLVDLLPVAERLGERSRRQPRLGVRRAHADADRRSGRHRLLVADERPVQRLVFLDDRAVATELARDERVRRPREVRIGVWARELRLRIGRVAADLRAVGLVLRDEAVALENGPDVAVDVGAGAQRAWIGGRRAARDVDPLHP